MPTAPPDQDWDSKQKICSQVAHQKSKFQHMMDITTVSLDRQQLQSRSTNQRLGFNIVLECVSKVIHRTLSLKKKTILTQSPTSIFFI